MIVPDPICCQVITNGSVDYFCILVRPRPCRSSASNRVSFSENQVELTRSPKIALKLAKARHGFR